MRNTSRHLVIRVLFLEGVLLIVAFVWAWLRKLSLSGAFSMTLGHSLAGLCIGLFLLGTNYVLVEYGSRSFKFFRTVQGLIECEISPLFKQFNLTAIAAVALLSGLAEELLFRGVLQAEIGLCFASILFGAAHVWSKAAIAYGVYAAIVGLFFGITYLWSGNLWTPTLAHMVNNLAALLYYRHTLTHAKKSVVSDQTPL